MDCKKISDFDLRKKYYKGIARDKLKRREFQDYWPISTKPLDELEKINHINWNLYLSNSGINIYKNMIPLPDILRLDNPSIGIIENVEKLLLENPGIGTKRISRQLRVPNKFIRQAKEKINSPSYTKTVNPGYLKTTMMADMTRICNNDTNEYYFIYNLEKMATLIFAHQCEILSLLSDIQAKSQEEAKNLGELAAKLFLMMPLINPITQKPFTTKEMREIIIIYKHHLLKTEQLQYNEIRKTQREFSTLLDPFSWVPEALKDISKFFKNDKYYLKKGTAGLVLLGTLISYAPVALLGNATIYATNILLCLSLIDASTDILINYKELKRGDIDKHYFIKDSFYSIGSLLITGINSVVELSTPSYIQKGILGLFPIDFVTKSNQNLIKEYANINSRVITGFKSGEFSLELHNLIKEINDRLLKYFEGIEYLQTLKKRDDSYYKKSMKSRIKTNACALKKLDTTLSTIKLGKKWRKTAIKDRQNNRRKNRTNKRRNSGYNSNKI